MIQLGTEPFLSPGEAAELLQIHPNSVKTHIKAGRLEGVKIGGLIKTTRSAVERFVKRYQPAAAGGAAAAAEGTSHAAG